MSRIAPIEMEAATGKAAELLQELAGRGGEPGPMVLTMANAPVVLIELARQGPATDPRIPALVAYGQQLIAAPGEVSDAQVAGLRAHGYTDEQIAEVVALAALQLLTGAFNLVAGIEPADSNESSSARSAA